MTIAEINKLQAKFQHIRDEIDAGLKPYEDNMQAIAEMIEKLKSAVEGVK